MLIERYGLRRRRLLERPGTIDRPAVSQPIILTTLHPLLDAIRDVTTESHTESTIIKQTQRKQGVHNWFVLE